MALIDSWSSGTAPNLVGAAEIDASVGIPTSPAIHIPNSGAAAYARFDLGDSYDTISARFYMRTPPAFASQAATIFGLRPTNSSVALGVTFAGTGDPGRLRLTTTGGSTLASTPMNTLEPETDYRVEVTYNSVTAEGSMALYSLGSNVPIWSGTATDATNWTQPIIRVDAGRMNTNPALASWWLDSIEIHDTIGTIGRDEDDELPPSAGATWAIWNGTTLDPVSSVQVWNGSSLSEVSATEIT